MDEAQRVIVAIRLAKCREDMATAREDSARGRYRAAVARAYYAVFHITGAVLLTIGVERAKHSGVEAAISEFLVKPGHIESEYAAIYRRARRFREEQEYSDEFERLDALRTDQILSDAERFIVRLEEYLHEAGATD